MKKTILTLFASLLMTAIGVTTLFAQASLNSPGSMPTLTISNVSTNPCNMGPIDGCWKQSTSAAPGQQIAVHVYYKNTGNQNSLETTLSIKPQSTSNVSSVTFTGGVASITAPRSVGSATAYLNTPSSVKYIAGSARWYPNSSSGGQAVNESGLFGTTGFNIGTIAPGQQGVLVANFIVEGVAQQKPQCSDGIDNDGDGLIDYPADPGCTSPNDNDEYNAPIVTKNCRINDFSVNGRTSISIERGQSVNLSWNTTDCEYVTVTNFNGNINPNSSFSVNPSQNTTYTLRAYPNGSTATVQVNVFDTPVNPTDNCRINDFSVNGRTSITIQEGDSARLNWNTTGCEYVTVTGFSGNLSANSSGTIRPTSDRTYTLRAYPNGSTATVQVYVQRNNSQKDRCDINEFRSNRTSIERGQVATIYWNVTGADNIDITPGYRNRSNNGSLTVSPSSTTTYTISVSGKNCSNSSSITISVDERDSSNPQAITTVAAITGPNSAQLNGIAVPNTVNVASSTWFEWGPSRSLGQRTGSRHIGAGNGSTTHGDTITGLVAGTTYYYRIVVQNNNGTAYGDIVSFRTSSVTTTNPTTPTQPTRVIVQTIRDSVTTQSAPSLLELQVASAYDHMCINGEMEYVVTYRNISATTLEDAVLRLSLPKELTYVGANRGSYDSLDRFLTLGVGRLAPGEQGSVTLRARFNDNAVRGNLAVMTATVVYTNPTTRAQEDAIAYSLVTVSDECPRVLGASVYGFGSFLPDTLLEWLLLILVILALIILGRNLYKKREEEKKA